MRTIKPLLFLIVGLMPLAALAQNRCAYSLVTFKTPNGIRYGLDSASHSTVPSQVFDITEEIKEVVGEVNTPSGREAFFSKRLAEKLMRLQCALERGEANAENRIAEISRDEILPAIPQPTNIVAVGLNARSHAEEVGKDGADGFVFAKNVPLTGAYADIIRPAKSLLDYEVELGVVFRSRVLVGMQITPENVTDFIAGFVLTNDVSNRVPIALEAFDGGFTLAKTYPTFLPVGPVFVPIERFLPDGKNLVPNLAMLLSVQTPGNDPEVRQRGMTNEDFYLDLTSVVREALAKRHQTSVGADGRLQKLLRYGAFEAGDLLLLGTVAGTALRLRSDKVVGYTLNAHNFQPGSAFHYFWPAYQRYFPDHGGGFPVNQMRHWMALKTHWVREEYCFNRLYLAPGQIVTNSIEGLGIQINTVAADSDEASTEEARALASPSDYARLCLPDAEARPHLGGAAATSVAISGGLGAAGWHTAGNLTPGWVRWPARGGIVLTALLHSVFQTTRAAWSNEVPAETRGAAESALDNPQRREATEKNINTSWLQYQQQLLFGDD